MPTVTPGDEEEAAGRGSCGCWRVGKKAEQAACADERSVCAARFSSGSVECAPRSREREVCVTPGLGVWTWIQRWPGEPRDHSSQRKDMVYLCLNTALWLPHGQGSGPGQNSWPLPGSR